MAKKTKPLQIVESILPNIRAGRVDREAGVIHDVRIAGLISKNGRTYTEAAFKNATALYEGKPCNVNHVEEGVQVKTEDRLGIWKNVRWSDTPEPGLIANLHYLKSHPMAERVCEAAERPDLSTAFGCSHTAGAGDSRPGKDGNVIIESIAEVKSVDLVADPATVNGLFESTGNKPMKKASIKALVEAAFNFPFQKRLWEASIKDEDLCKRITEEIETPDGASAVDAANAAINSLAAGIATDGTLAPKDKGSKVEALATLHAKMLNGEDETPEPKKKDDETPTKKESVIGVVKAGHLCESLKFTPSIKQLTLISEATEANAKSLAEEFFRLSLVKPEQEPVSAARVEPVQESTQQKPASNSEELAARIR